jgi:hypothetical protein
MNTFCYKSLSTMMIRKSSCIKPHSINRILYMSTINDNKLVDRLKVKKILEASDR